MPKTELETTKKLIVEIQSLITKLEAEIEKLEAVDETPDLPLVETAQKPEITKDDVKALLVSKSKAGFGDEVRKFIYSMGYERISAIEKQHYEYAMTEGAKIGVTTDA